ncbi:XRE family transcriptional regulator [Aurantimonas coralicida]|uniref:XRE family transcriptional regulator n=1 Tax=Aurantimonas coralicida TaxID=182270 RepID=UPI0023A54419|nr:XRE family transcriptional regulator [Aurantimonas coralicida]MDE0924888.1 XRE family transcriptional regulator [Aurantimonas coralicida]
MIDMSKIAERVHWLRKERGISQADVASALGFNDRQTVSAFENGERALKPTELVTLAKLFRMPVDQLADPFRLSQRADFSFRMSRDVSKETVSSFEEKAKEWIGAFRELARETGTLRATLPSIGIGPRSSLEDAEAEAERLAGLHFGSKIPAKVLPKVIENDLNTLVLMVDADVEISGAACHMVDLNTVLVNRREVGGRRNFDLAHELFHILTWKELPPAYFDGDGSKSQDRTEKLADKFAITLLTPVQKLLEHRTADVATAAWMNRTANVFGVTAVALSYRVLNLKWITKAQRDGIDYDAMKWNGGPAQADLPPLFGAKFAAAVAAGILEHKVSVRKIARILGVTVDALGDILEDHGHGRVFDL